MRILRGLTSRILPCGCLAGVYETYNNLTVAIIDERGGECADPAHQAGKSVPELSHESASRRSVSHR